MSSRKFLTPAGNSRILGNKTCRVRHPAIKEPLIKSSELRISPVLERVSPIGHRKIESRGDARPVDGARRQGLSNQNFDFESLGKTHEEFKSKFVFVC